MKLIPDGEDGESALYLDDRCGFSQVIPGHPRLVEVVAGEGEPVAHAAVAIADLPLTMRWRLDYIPGNLSPGPLAAALVQAYASRRAPASPDVFSAPPDRLAAWGCAGAASALYPLRQPGGEADTEEVFILVRPDPEGGSQAMVVSKRFASFTARVRFAAFTVAANAELRWRPGEAPPTAPARVWPASSFLVPGVACKLLPERERAARELAAALAGARDADLERAAERVAMLATGGSEPPATPLTAAMRSTFSRYFADASPPPAAGEAFRRLLEEATTSHDLRGVACMLIVALTGTAGTAAS